VARVRKSDVAVLVEIDAATSQLLGWGAGDMVGRTSLEFIHPDDQQLAVDNWMQMLSSHGPGSAVRLRHRHSDGSWVWVEMTNHNLLDDPAANCILAEMVDISDEMFTLAPTPDHDQVPVPDPAQQPRRLHDAIRAREQLLHRLAEALPLGVLQVDAEGRVVYTNHRLHGILGKARTATAARQLSMVLGEDKARLDEAFEAVLRGGLDSDIEVRLGTSDAHGTKDVRQCTMSLRSLTAESGAVTGAIVCVADITDSVRIREELRIRATFDDVTGCHNRASTMEALEGALAATSDEAAPAVIFVDLVRFKEVNDRLGHAAGDELLGIVARRLRAAVRAEDLVGRIGGDEFLVVCPRMTSATQAMQLATRVADALRRRVRLKATSVPCQASIGVAWATGPATDADALVSHADEAMYEAKRIGSGHPVLFGLPGAAGGAATG
jgi:diguanylate cyclase (GGDEF)-like protein/PAS domain S-box-containing protein